MFLRTVLDVPVGKVLFETLVWYFGIAVSNSHGKATPITVPNNTCSCLKETSSTMKAVEEALHRFHICKHILVSLPLL